MTSFDYAVLAFYFVFMLVISWGFRRFITNVSGYFRRRGEVLWCYRVLNNQVAIAPELVFLFLGQHVHLFFFLVLRLVPSAPPSPVPAGGP